MTPEEANETYQVLANQAGEYANALTQRAGLAQASYGVGAQDVMGESQTGGIGNYTYNRLVRPTVDTLRDQLVVQGRTEMLNQQISDAVKAAKENYDNTYKEYQKREAAKRAAQYSTGGGTTTVVPETPTNTNTWSGEYETEEEQKQPLAGTTVIGNSYTVIKPNGERFTFDRKENMADDMKWYKWIQSEKARFEGLGYKFLIGD